MPYTRSILVSALLAILLIGCKKAETPPAPKMDSSGSVAAPAATLPSSEANTPSAVTGTATGTATGSGDASGTTQASPKELSKEQESTSMPLSGQANNHSTAAPSDNKK